MERQPATIRVTSPIDGSEVGIVAVTPPEAVGSVVAAARSAFDTWARLDHPGRRPYLRSYARTVLKNMDRIAGAIAAETGKNLGDAHAEITAALTAMDLFSRHAGRLLTPKRGRAWPFPTVQGWTEYHPRGVAGIISPWNYPFYLPMLSVIQALAAGCTVVVKPSEVAPLSGELIAQLAAEAGIPSGVVNVIHGTGVTGEALVRADIDIVAFTGATETGRRIAMVAAETLKPVVLELGGKDAMIVLEDANVKRAARAAATFGTFNAGQTCVAVERVYVVDEVYDEFIAALDKALGELRAGSRDRRDVGPIVTPAQLDIIEAHVMDATNRGATVLRGDKRNDGEGAGYFEPTLIVDVDHSMALMRDETFGPVVPVMRVADEAEALAFANDTRYGLHGSVWSGSRSRARRVASGMNTGSVAINDHLVNFFYPSITLAGIGDSGLGGVMGDEGIKAFCIPRSITRSRFSSTTKLMGAWLPRRVGPRYWKALARVLFGWRR